MPNGNGTDINDEYSSCMYCNKILHKKGLNQHELHCKKEKGGGNLIRQLAHWVIVALKQNVLFDPLTATWGDIVFKVFVMWPIMIILWKQAGHILWANTIAAYIKNTTDGIANLVDGVANGTLTEPPCAILHMIRVNYSDEETQSQPLLVLGDRIALYWGNVFGW